LENDAAARSMSTEEESKKSGLNYALLIGVLVIVAISLCMVPFAAIGLSIKKSGILGHFVEGSQNNKTSNNSGQADFSALRATLEKAAANTLKDQNLKTITEFIKIETPSADAMAKTKLTVGDVLRAGNQQFVEAIDPGQIRIIVILKSKDWPTLSNKIMDAADIEGFIYHGPSSTATAGDADTVVAEIEITKRK
jgi:hypothetical protein